MPRYYHYYVDTTLPNLTLEIDNVLMFDAKFKHIPFQEAFTIDEQMSGNQYSLKVFRHNMFYWGEEKIEIYNEKKEVIMKFSFGWNYVNYIFPKIQIIENDKNISLANTEKKNLIYETDEDGEIRGYYEQFLLRPGVLTYNFETMEMVTNHFHLVMACFCHRALIRRYSY